MTAAPTLLIAQVTSSADVTWTSGDISLASAWTHTGGTLALASASGVLSGAGTMTVSGATSVLLKADNSVTSINATLLLRDSSALSVTAGTLELGGGGAWDDGTTVTVGGSATLRVTTQTVTAHGVLAGASGAVEISGGVLEVNQCPVASAGVAFSVTGGELRVAACPVFVSSIAVHSGLVSVAADCSCGGALTLAGSGAVLVRPAVALTLLAGGSFDSSSGVQLQAASSALILAGGAFALRSATAIVGGGTVSVTGRADVTVSAALGGLTASSSFTVGSGSLTLDASSFTAPLRVLAAGTLRLATATTLQGVVTVVGGALTVGAGPTQFAGGLVVDGAAAAVAVDAAASVTAGVCNFSHNTLALSATFTTTIDCSTSGAAVTGAGTWSVTAGTVTLGTPAAAFGPLLSVGAAGQVVINANTLLSGGMAVTGELRVTPVGMLDVAAGAACSIADGRLEVALGAKVTLDTDCRQSGGALGGAGEVAISGSSFAWTGGQWVGSGLVALSNRTALSVGGAVRVATSVSAPVSLLFHPPTHFSVRHALYLFFVHAGANARVGHLDDR